MDKKELLQILLKEVKEISELLDGFTECNVIPKVLIKMAAEKADALAVGINELNGCNHDIDVFNEKTSLDSISFKKDSNIKEESLEKDIFKESKNIEQLEENVAKEDNGSSLNDKAEPQISNQSSEKNLQIEDSKSLFNSKYSEKVEFVPLKQKEEPTIGAETVKSDATMQSNPQNKDFTENRSVENGYNQSLTASKINSEKNAEFSKESDKSHLEATLSSVNDSKPLAEVFEKVYQPQPKTNVSSAYHTNDIRKLLTLNDRFLFQRELFRGDVGMLNYVLNEINGIETLDDALDFISKKFNWNPEAEGVDQFIELVERFYNNKTDN
ncbi:MAG: hypothetical protein Q4F97_10120 [Bacteroidales bacterium]|nr:hypothetical protein [Bacteroidales bacterium]